MSRRAATCPLDISDHTSQIKKRDTIFNDLWNQAIIPLETGFLTRRMSSFTPSKNDGLLRKSLDLIEKQRENAMVQLAYYQHKLKQRYDVNVKLRPLAPRDLVLRKVLGTAKNPAWRKLRPNWEGSYRITSMARIGAYYLENLDENVVPHP